MPPQTHPPDFLKFAVVALVGCVVHQQIDGPEFLFCLGGDMIAYGGIANISTEQHRFPSFAGDKPHGLLGIFILRVIADGHIRTFTSEG